MIKWILLLILLTCLIPQALANHSQRSAYFTPNELAIGFYDKHVLPNNPPRPPHPFFWKSRLKVDNGLTLLYEYVVFHTQKYFSVNFGGSLSRWVAKKQSQYALSFLFDLRVWLFRTNYFNPYVTCGFGAPTLLSRRLYAGANLGEHFIFQDFLGIGAQMGKIHQFDINLRLYHYSNADLFFHNDGFDVPLVLTVGYVF